MSTRLADIGALKLIVVATTALPQRQETVSAGEIKKHIQKRKKLFFLLIVNPTACRDRPDPATPVIFF
ncbi:hypothetical protein [Tellurirhabdus rosea]|uniref:hypothetical protein n=1 Tax=Tellurirhabdus rosea TaxID=2674997 RepID=UPI00224F4E13|nr:hypothetical protein [Tellurirhabdus rosea]